MAIFPLLAKILTVNVILNIFILNLIAYFTVFTFTEKVCGISKVTKLFRVHSCTDLAWQLWIYDIFVPFEE